MIRSLLHVGMTVPDLEAGRSFYQLFGLESHASGSDLVFRCANREQDQIRLMEGPKKRLSYISLGTDDVGMLTLKTRLERAGVRITETPFRADSGGIWFQDPHGDWVNVQVEQVISSTMPAPPEVNSPGQYRRIGTRACSVESMQKRARPRRLGHLIKFTPDVDRSVAFYTEVLGMKVSDRAHDILAFLRGSSGGDHHILAFAKSTHTGLHHLSFEVGDIDEIEIGAQTLIRAGYEDVFGLGRHVGGSNYFHYIRDPWNSLVEYFWDIDIIPEDDSAWIPLNVSPEELTAVWAAKPPAPGFELNFELPD
ncbi:VOC family protein [Paraburkholderia hospita]|uniref:VOC family protein n=1 Tax=Paraburkholderia hospita TaxID=169430 RepID=UPI0008A740BF|nr:VOC family protein [Paraburkholderia hospita]SEI17779.1 Catechol 2,3-dioxygenase [Paraburkholderia hospita]